MADPYFPWSDDYSVGIRLIDSDHRELFDTVNELHGVIESGIDFAAVRHVTVRLVRYVQEHFAREEHLMAEYHYPELADHRKRHHDFVRMIFAVRKIEQESPESLDLDKLLSFLKGWLKRHILVEDRAYIPHLTGQYGRRKTDETTPVRVLAETAGTTPEAEEIVIVPVQVPASSVNTIRRCARLLRTGGDGAAALAALTDPIVSMTLSEALDIAKVVLRETGRE